MGREKDLNDEEKTVIIKETAKGTTFFTIAERLGRHVDTVKRSLKDPSARKKRSNCGTSMTVTDRNLRNIGHQFSGKPGKINESISTTASCPNVAMTTRNRIPGTMASVRDPLKMFPLMPRYKN